MDKLPSMPSLGVGKSSGSSISGSNSAVAWEYLEEAETLGDLLGKAKDKVWKQTLPEYLKTLSKQRKLKQAKIAEDSGQDPGYVSLIFSGKKNPSRDRLIAIAFGMRLNVKETQRALRLAGHVELHPTTERDLLILYAIQHKMNISDTDDALYDYGFPTLLSKDG